MQDIILDTNEAKMRQKEIDDKMKEMLEDNSDEEDVDVTLLLLRKCSRTWLARSMLTRRSR